MKNLHERIELIKRTQKAREEERHDGQPINYYIIKDWQGGSISRPIIKIPAEFLMYRIENSRTFRQQLQYIHSRNLPQNFFTNPESKDVQAAQEEILLSLIHDSSSGPSFINDLHDRGQDDPAIITFEGYIVNGNRRVAALKELGELYINCVVLPDDASKKDIYALEHLLQITEDFKEPYHWVNELNNFDQGIHDKSLEFTEDQMAKVFRIKKTELISKLRTMMLINEFLNWKGIPKHYEYERLDFAEEAFRQLEKGTRDIGDEHKRQELIHAVFHLIENPPAKGRLYAPVIELINKWDEIYNRIITSKKEKSQNEVRIKTEISSNDDILDKLIADKNADKPEIFGTSSGSEELADKLYETIADIKAEKKEKFEANAVYDGVSAALRELLNLSVSEKTANLESIRNKIKQIIQIANSLSSQIDKYDR